MLFTERHLFHFTLLFSYGFLFLLGFGFGWEMVGALHGMAWSLVRERFDFAPHGNGVSE